MKENVNFEAIYARFLKDLTKPLHSKPEFRNTKREAKDDEVSLSEISLLIAFPDPENLLESAFRDFDRFLSAAGIKKSPFGIPLSINYIEGNEKEEYIINVSRKNVTLSSSDTEGIRRGIIFIEDEMKRREGHFLPLGEIRRKPFIKKRISRCYFTPPSHASNDGLKNELEYDVDFYPDEYLNRLSHDGINGLWLGASFRDILKSDIIPEYGKDSYRRLKKLREIVKKCKRYGIGIYLFSVEPASVYNNPNLEKHPDLLGGYGWGGRNRMFCISTNEGERYLRESVKKLFVEVPDLAGFINITTGECLSGCGSDVTFNCPRCLKKYGSHAKTLCATEKIIAESMADVNPNAEFISWTYSQRAWQKNDIEEACRIRDKKVIHMQNFEDLGLPIQLGEERIAIDYWLSYVGPGELMKDTVSINNERSIRTYAKIQACSSHEISTVPYVPVPGILYDKFSYMREHKIDGVMLCWYFGNYPCLMNKCTCELSFEPNLTTKLDFLHRIASIYFGSDASIAVEGLLKFEEGYKNFPVNLAFEWYGPMQDSVIAPLYLIPKDKPMPESWLCTASPGGDRIGESLLDGHTLEEAVTLCESMYDFCSKGAKHLSTVTATTDEAQDIISVASAISLIFKSGYNTLKFYNIRHKLAIGEQNAREALKELEDVVKEEISNSEELIKLCRSDNRLGFHSEAHGYKFSVDTLYERIDSLKELLSNEFPVVQERISERLAPIEFYLGESEGYQRLILNSHKEFVFASSSETAYTRLTAKESDGTITLTFILEDENEDVLTIKPEFHLFHPSAPFTLSSGTLHYPDNNQFSFFGKRAEKRRKDISCEYIKGAKESIYNVSFKRCSFGISSKEPIRISVERKGLHNETLLPRIQGKDRLIFGNTHPREYLFIVADSN